LHATSNMPKHVNMQRAMKTVSLMLFRHAGQATRLIVLHLFNKRQLGKAFASPTAGISGALHSQQPPSRPNLKSHSCALAVKPAGIETNCELKQLWTLHCAGPVSTQAKAMRHWQLWPGGANLTSRASKRPPSASGQDRPSLHSTRTVLKSMWLMVCQSKQVCRSLLCCTCVNSDAMQEYHTRCCS